MTSIPGASVWEQELYDNLARHVRTEGDIIDDYRRLAAETSSEAFRYLARLIVEDEERHHRFFAELTETVQAFSQLQTEGQPVPFLTSGGADGEELGARTEHFLRVERDDLKELGVLSKQLRPVRDTTLWGLLVELMEMDTRRHIRILEFIRDHVAR